MKPKFELGTNVFYYSKNENRIFNEKITGIFLENDDSGVDIFYETEGFHRLEESRLFLTRQECIDSAVLLIQEFAKKSIEDILYTKEK